MKNPLDGRFKTSVEDYPEQFLRLLGLLPPGSKPPIIDVLREIQLDPVHIDHGFKVGEGDESRIIHLEAISRWHAERVDVLALYNFLLKRKYKIPVASHLLLMLERFAPRKLPEKLVWEDVDGQRIETPYQVTRLWELDSEILFEPGFEPLLEWVPLLKDGLARAAEAAEVIEQMAAGERTAPYSPVTMAVHLAMHATLRYDRGVLEQFLERVRKKMSLSKEIWKDSWVWQDAKTEGIVEGEARGELRGTRKMIRRMLDTKFPAEPFDGLDRVPPDALEELMVAILRADKPEDARSVIASSIRLQ